jgi:hypothetical protein
MASAETSEQTTLRGTRMLWRCLLSRGAPLALGLCLLLAAAQTGFAAGLLGGSHTGALPSLAPLPAPGTGSLPTLGSGSTPDTGTILGPSLSIPLSTPTVGPLNDPLAAVPNIGSDLPVGVSPELKDLS